MIYERGEKVNHCQPELVYPNFVYPPIFEGINEPVRMSSDVNELSNILLGKKIRIRRGFKNGYTS